MKIGMNRRKLSTVCHKIYILSPRIKWFIILFILKLALICLFQNKIRSYWITINEIYLMPMKHISQLTERNQETITKLSI